MPSQRVRARLRRYQQRAESAPAPAPDAAPPCSRPPKPPPPPSPPTAAQPAATQRTAAQAARAEPKAQAAATRAEQKTVQAATTKARPLEQRTVFNAARPHDALGKKRGISESDYVALLESQGGRCAICRTLPQGKRLDLDHDHATNKGRGFLCHDGNQLLARAKDDPDRLLAAIASLQRPP